MWGLPQCPQPVKWGAARLGSLLGVPEGLTCSWWASRGQQESWVGAACHLRSSAKAKGRVNAGLAGQPLKLPSPGPALTWGPTPAMPRGGVTLCMGPMLECPGGRRKSGLRSGPFPRVDTRCDAFWDPGWLVRGQQLELPYSP